MNKDDKNLTQWWGQFDITVNSAAQWQIETLRFAIHHVDTEWQISHQRELQDESLNNQLSFSRELFDPLDYPGTTRHIFRKSTSAVELKPQLADRTVVTRPSTPISLAPGEEVTLYISTPLWIQFEIAVKVEIP